MSYLSNRKAKRIERDRLVVLACVANGDCYATEIWERTGMNVGRIYAMLIRLEDTGFIYVEWDNEPIKRKMYLLTFTGEGYLRGWTRENSRRMRNT